MKILWVKSDFLHPTNRGGQIRTLEMLKCLHKRHEIHYVAFDDGKNPEGIERSSEYCSCAYAVPNSVPPHRSLRFVGQLCEGLVSPMPVAVKRYASVAMKRQIQKLLDEQRFDSLVCDFLFPASNLPDISRSVLFQHNVESVIWQRHFEQAKNPAKRAYFKMQAQRMRAFEMAVCRRAGRVVVVSESDRENMRSLFGVDGITCVETGVDLQYFAPRRPLIARSSEPGLNGKSIASDLIFTGSMDWLPNIDAVQFFAGEILRRIRKERPNVRFMIAGRRPSSAVRILAARDSGIGVSGTVSDIRPYLWASTVAVVPLRVAGGTRLKIFEAMAAKLPVVSTSIGAEGLPVENGRHLAIADEPESFARCCLDLLADAELRSRTADRAWNFVSSRFSWDAVTREFEVALKSGPRPN